MSISRRRSSKVSIQWRQWMFMLKFLSRVILPINLNCRAQSVWLIPWSSWSVTWVPNSRHVSISSNCSSSINSRWVDIFLSDNLWSFKKSTKPAFPRSFDSFKRPYCLSLSTSFSFGNIGSNRLEYPMKSEIYKHSNEEGRDERHSNVSTGSSAKVNQLISKSLEGRPTFILSHGLIGLRGSCIWSDSSDGREHSWLPVNVFNERCFNFGKLRLESLHSIW